MDETIQVTQSFELTHSDSIAKLAEALAKAQLKFKPVLKQSDNPAYMRGGKASKYADLANVIEATQPYLAAEGLTIVQWPDVNVQDKSTKLTSMLLHSSGEWIRGITTLPAVSRDAFTAQSCGSAITYARRYSYQAIIGVAAEDDDGNAASLVGSKEEAQEIAKRKLAEHEAKTHAAEAPKAAPEVTLGEGPLNEVKRFQKKDTKQPYLRMTQNGVDMVMWDNYMAKVSGEDMPIFSLLLTSKGKFCQFKLKKDAKGYTAIRAMQIGEKKWDDAGEEYRELHDDVQPEFESRLEDMPDREPGNEEALWPR